MEQQKSRTHYAKLNTSLSLFNSLSKIILGFVTKTFFIKFLGVVYLGVTGLFSEVLQFLSVAELGIGTAIVFSMYKNIRENNKEKIQALYKLYKKCYIIIGAAILGLGLCTMPLLPFMISDYENYSFLQLPFIYVLYLFNTAIPYFLFSYRNCVLNAHQEGFYIKVINTVVELLKSGVLILILFLTRNFYFYLCVSIFFAVMNEFVISIVARKRYAYVFSKNDSQLSKEEKKDVFVNVAALALYSIGGKLYAATDNIIISKLLGLETVGVYSNYAMLIGYVTTLVQSIFYALTPSVANIPDSDKQKKNDIFNKINYLTFVLYGTTFVCLFCLLNPFIEIWLQDELYILNVQVVSIISLNYLLAGLGFASAIFRDAYGLYRYGKFRPLIQGLINIILSIIMGIYLGLIGIFIATMISYFLTIFWFEPYMVHKRVLEQSLIRYFIRYVVEVIAILLVAAIAYFSIAYIPIAGGGGFILKAFMVGVIAVAGIISISLFDKNHKYFVQLIFSKFRRRKNEQE